MTVLTDDRLTLDELVRALPLAWNDETRESPRYQGQHPAAGQAMASVSLIQRHCGGKILACEVGGEYSRTKHYINELDGGVRIDVTAGQFMYRSPVRKFQKVEPAKDPETLHKVDILEYRVRDFMGGFL